MAEAGLAWRTLAAALAVPILPKLGERIGRLDDDRVRLNRAILVFLGMA